MCWNLRHKSYCIRNKQYSPGEYKQELERMKRGSWAALLQNSDEFANHLKSDGIHKPDFNTQTEQCVGNFLEKCKSCIDANMVSESVDSYDVFRGHQDKDCMITSGLFNGELCSWVVQATNLFNVHYALYSVDCSNAQYLDQCQGCEECFGCVGLFKRKYCILNKQYSESDYRAMRDRIIKKMKERGEYGRFFPWSMAYNGYNASLAALYFPDETRTSIEARGGKWEEPPKSSVSGIVSDQLPDHIADVGDDIVGKVIECAKTGRSFNIIKQEFAFYKKHGIPLPRYYPDGRNWRRYHYVLAADPRTVACCTCKTSITTYYPEAWGYEKIACQKCYAAQVL